MIDGVIFDIDGTLVDSVDFHAKAWQEAFAHFGRTFPFDRIRHQIGKGGDQLMPEFLKEEEIEAFGEKLEQFRGDLYKRKYLPDVQAFPKIRALFERIKSDGKRIVLATSSKEDKLQAYLDITGIGDLIENATSADDVEESKPHPDIFEAALVKLGKDFDPAKAIAVGDTPYDARAAGKIGLRTIGVLCGGFPEKELRGAGCIAIYQDPADLLAHYEDSPLVRSSDG